MKSYVQMERYLQTVQLGDSGDKVLEELGEHPRNGGSCNVAEYKWHNPRLKNEWLSVSIFYGIVIKIQIAHEGFVQKKAMSQEDVKRFMSSK